MPDSTRRDFLGLGSLAALGLGTLTLRADAMPTAASGSEGIPTPFNGPQDKLQATEKNIEGPYFRAGAPFRAKVTPPLAPGKVLLVRGRVWGFDTKKPLPGARIHIWQADTHGRYDNDDPTRPPAEGVFVYRARLLADEGGYYEYETIHPGRYKIGPKAWRPAHVHYRVEAPGYQTLITQLYFKGDPFNATDPFIRKSLIIDLEQIGAAGGRRYARGDFDIVLRRS